MESLLKQVTLTQDVSKVLDEIRAGRPSRIENLFLRRPQKIKLS